MIEKTEDMPSVLTGLRAPPSRNHLLSAPVEWRDKHLGMEVIDVSVKAASLGRSCCFRQDNANLLKAQIRTGLICGEVISGLCVFLISSKQKANAWGRGSKSKASAVSAIGGFQEENLLSRGKHIS